MKELICKKTGNNKSISIDSVYTLISETENRYSLINDKGIQKNYSKNLFEEYIAPDPIRLITDINVNINRTEGTTFRINLTSNDDLLNTTVSVTLSTHSSNISCGIREIDGLNNLFSALNEIRNYINNTLNDTIRLAEDINIENLLVNIIDSILQEIYEINTSTGIFLFSTNVTNNGHIRIEYINFLNEVSTSNVTTRNPNSGNNITLWTIIREED